MSEISDEAVRAYNKGREEHAGYLDERTRAGLRAALPHLRAVTVDAATRERMADAAHVAWYAAPAGPRERSSWRAAVDAVLALVPQAVPDAPAPPARDPRLAAVATWRDYWGPYAIDGGDAAKGVRALHSLLSELLTRVSALERGR